MHQQVSDSKIAVLWLTEIPENKNTTRYQRAKQLNEIYPCDFYTIGDLPNEFGDRRGYSVDSSKGILRQSLFLFISIFSIIYNRKEYDMVHTSYHPPTAAAGVILSIFNLQWVHDIWDHPKLLLTTATEDKREKFHKRVKIQIKTVLYNYSYTRLYRADLVVIGMHPDVMNTLPIEQRSRINTIKIPNGTDISNYSDYSSNEKNEEIFRMVYVGAVRPDRGTDMILESVSQIEDRNNIEIIFVGSVEYDIQSIISKYDLEQSVTVTGRLTHKQALNKISISDVGFCLFPKIEQLEYVYPIKLFEYMALGTIPVGTDLKGISDVIEHGVSGYLVQPDDVEDIYNIIDNSDNEDIDKIKRNARDSVMKYDWDRINNDFKENVTKLLS